MLNIGIVWQGYSVMLFAARIGYSPVGSRTTRENQSRFDNKNDRSIPFSAL
ncbi:Hypothetical protein CpCap5W_0539 [Corynebacterium pseudotuberculosis]|nr:hypothetical protein CpPA02_0491 [Corynebacterium pseudotuberculosis]ARX64230.1 Hypothetical protein Cp262_2130 [Corynebacterium pseudotuberculosis]AUY06530.1 Hypothetical protein CpOVI2C_00517 [Corynebacterium pseudotuberculosis]AZN21504.1 Hypothetical protein CpOviAF1_0537 [Corynebacterium pseudotuberculosis]QBB90537.1 Hypothetical protein CpCR07_0539 [Corynebacterium pseudotuberculosis]